jgi:hypothetical protein
VVASNGKRACPLASSWLPAAPERVGGLETGTQAMGRGDRRVPALRASGAPLPREQATSLQDLWTADEARRDTEPVGCRRASLRNPMRLDESTFSRGPGRVRSGSGAGTSENRVPRHHQW